MKDLELHNELKQLSGYIYKNGELVWVNAYVKSDGTKVEGYYRSRPHC